MGRTTALLRTTVLLLLWQREEWAGEELQLVDEGDHRGVSSCLPFPLLEDFAAFYEEGRNVRTYTHTYVLKLMQKDTDYICSIHSYYIQNLIGSSYPFS